jgi:hypothetical protein
MAERGFGATIKTELSAAQASLAILVQLDFVSFTRRWWSGLGDITYSAQTWTGDNTILSFDKWIETLDASDAGFTLGLNYLDDTLRNEVVVNDQIGRNVTVYFSKYDRTTNPPSIVDAYQWTGYMDAVDLGDSGQTATLALRVATESARWARPRFFKLTNAHQQAIFPGDTGLEYASKMNEVIYWGRKPVAPIVQLPVTPNPNISPGGGSGYTDNSGAYRPYVPTRPPGL